MGGPPCMAGHLCMYRCLLHWNRMKRLKLMRHMVNKPRGTSSILTDAFLRWGRLSTCSFSWETFMHGRTPLHGTPMNLWKPSKQLDWGGGGDFRCVVSHETHTQMVTYQNRIVTIPGTPPIHPDAFKRANTLPMCGLSFRKPRIGGHLCMEPHVRPSALLKPNYITHMLNIPKGTPSIHPDAFERWGRLPICSFSGGTAMHWRPSVHETLMCGCPPYWIPINMRQFMSNTGLTTREACLLSIQIHVKYGREF